MTSQERESAPHIALEMNRINTESQPRFILDDIEFSILDITQDVFERQWERYIAFGIQATDESFRLFFTEEADALTNTLNTLNDLPPPNIVQFRKRRRLVLKKGQKSYYKWKTIVKRGLDKCNGMCTICGEHFKEEEQVIEGATGQFYHRKEMLKWIRQPAFLHVKDPNTNLVLETYSLNNTNT